MDDLNPDISAEALRRNDPPAPADAGCDMPESAVDAAVAGCAPPQDGTASAAEEATLKLPWDVADTRAGEPRAPLGSQAPLFTLDPAFGENKVSARALPAALIAPPQHERSSAWTIPVMCIGLAIIAACLILPAVETNRRMSYEHSRLKMDLQQIEKQIAVNAEFLHKVKDDPTLAQRLALRQMKMIRAGTTTLDLGGSGSLIELNPSPFSILVVPPPVQLEPYRPQSGILATYCLDPKYQMYLIGLGLMMVAVGLILGVSSAPIIRSAAATVGTGG